MSFRQGQSLVSCSGGGHEPPRRRCLEDGLHLSRAFVPTSNINLPTRLLRDFILANFRRDGGFEFVEGTASFAVTLDVDSSVEAHSRAPFDFEACVKSKR